VKHVLWISAAIASGLYICGPVTDPDLWWHIVSGRWILAHHQFPVVDYWNMFGAGKPWRAYSWFIEIIFASIDQFAGGYRIYGLLILQMALSIGLALSIFYTLSKLAGDWAIGALLGVVTTVGCFDHFTLRPQTFVWIYFALTLLLASQASRSGLSRNRLLGLVALMVIWSNTHITAFFGVVIVFAWLAPQWKPAFKASLSCALATFVTPYHGGEYLSLFEQSGHPFSHSAIAEFQSANILQYTTAFPVLLVFILGVFIHYRPSGIQPFRLIVSAGFLVGGFAVIKFIPFALILLAALIAENWRDSAFERHPLGNFGEALNRLVGLINRLPADGLAFVLLAAAFVNGVKAWREPLNLEVIPLRAIDFIEEKKLAMPLLNDFGRGGYLMYRAADSAGNIPEARRVSIDGRTNVTPENVWEKFVDTLKGRNNWRDYIDMVKPGTILWRTQSPLTSILLYGSDWCRVFKAGSGEGAYSVFVRKDLLAATELKSENCQ